ncbi:hypothetical protein [Herbaspirillum rhizosphaerae]|uniref:hypothetical protein n=1 Tax=Herbaspirillum rhizosphaerae TaxID=346179 RepID=UPI0012EEAAE8|nr:hypothetical protein [Herbaspirillum rhizosphaerae]
MLDAVQLALPVAAFLCPLEGAFCASGIIPQTGILDANEAIPAIRREWSMVKRGVAERPEKPLRIPKARQKRSSMTVPECRGNPVELMIFTLVPLEDHAEKHVFPNVAMIDKPAREK